MGTQWNGPTLTADERSEQTIHDRRHPGLVCQTCPTEVAHQRGIDQWRADWAKREEWRMRWLPWLAMGLLLGCWLLGSWLLGPS